MKVHLSDRRRLAARLLVATRLGAGAVALLSPRAVLAAVHSGTAASEVPTRLLGLREISYGVLLGLARGGARRVAIGVGVATDLADAYVGAAEVRRGRASLPNIAIAVAALAASLLGVVALAPAKVDSDA